MPDQREHAIAGHCLCRAVSISVHKPKEVVELCHCDMCRRWGGAFCSAVTGESFTIEGEENAVVFRSSEWAERAFCGTCGSNLWYCFLPTGSRGFLAGLFSEADRYEVEREIFVDEKARWCEGAGDHPKLTGAQVIAEAKEAGFAFD